MIRRLVVPPGPTDPRESRQTEIRLSVARLLLASASLLAISIAARQTSEYAVSFTFVAAYVPYSLIVLVFLLINKAAAPSQKLQVILTAVDIAFIGAISGTQEPNSPFFGFLTFVLVTAAFRWGFLETVATGLVLWMTVQVVTLFWGTHDLYRFILRAAYLTVMSVLLGYLAHWDKRLKAERSLIARAMGRAQPDLGLSRTIEGVLDEILQFYDSNIALLPVLDRFTGRAYLTEYRIARDALPKVRITEIQPQDQEAWLFTSEAHAWHGFVSRKQGAGTFAVNEKGLHLPECRIDVRPDWVRQYEARSSLAVNVVFGEELSGRLYLLNPQLRGTRMTEVAFIQRFAQQVAPVIYTVYLWRRLRSKIGGIERAQIARDLHDGVIQSMVTLEMSIDVARTETEGAQRDTLLAKVQKLLRNEIHTLRELTHQLRGVNIRPGELVPYLVDMVERFGRDSGIHARLVSDNEDVVLPQRVCRNIVAIVQEALANVRKHSGARKVLVRFNCERGVWTLVIDDDGSGFDFSGALSFVELEEMRKGPVSIKERVRLLKGDLIIESNPGAGCRIFISAPVRAWA